MSNQGELFWNALVDISVQGKAVVLAMLEEGKLWSLLRDKAKTFWHRKGDEYTKTLERRTAALEAIGAPELTLRILGELNKIAGLEPRDYRSRRDFADNCDELVERAVRIQAERDDLFEGTNLTDLVRHLLAKQFYEMAGEVESLSEDRRRAVVEELRRYIESLPTEQQAHLRREIDADQLTDAVLTKALASGALAAAFAGLVNLGGFSVYVGATSALASVAGVFGIALPFSVYTGATSLVAVLSNPFLLVAVVGGGGIWGWVKADRRLRERLLPMIVVQVAAVGSHGASAPRSAQEEAILGEWHLAVSTVRKARAVLSDLKEKLARERELRESRERDLTADSQALADLESQRDERRAALVQALASTWSAELRRRFERHVDNAAREIGQSAERMDWCRGIPVAPGGASRLEKAFAASAMESLVERGFVGVLEELSSEIVSAALEDEFNLTEVRNESTRTALSEIRHDSRRVIELAARKAEHQSAIVGHSTIERRLRDSIRDAERVKTTAEGRYWGLAEAT